MTPPAPARTRLTTLDLRITEALTTLRMARSVGSPARTQAESDAEARAEANLNALLDCRNAAQRR